MPSRNTVIWRIRAKLWGQSESKNDKKVFIFKDFSSEGYRQGFLKVSNHIIGVHKDLLFLITYSN